MNGFRPADGDDQGMRRRDFLRRASVATLPMLYVAQQPLAGWAADREGRSADRSGSGGLIVREKEPVNLESPFNNLKSFLTPNNQFYVRNHFPAPKLDARTWRLKVEGAVRRPLTLDYEAVRRMPARTQTAVLECAGNGRAFLKPKAGGVQWQLGAVSNAEWTGVPLAVLLDRAGLTGDAVEVILEGADSGEITAPTKPRGAIHFARSLPLAKARSLEVLLAYRMNGAELPALHGFPLRAVVPGWYGVASIKWLTRVIVTDRPFRGYFQSIDYSYWGRRYRMPTLVPITEMQVRAEIARPAAGEEVPEGKDYRVHGAAWTGGDAEVERVDVSTDGGKTWRRARLLGRPRPFTWRLWEFPWRPTETGKVQLLARATDDRGRVQVLTRDPDRRNYMISHAVPVEVTVR